MTRKSRIFSPIEEESDQNEWEPLDLSVGKKNEALPSERPAAPIESSSSTSKTVPLITTDPKQSSSSDEKEKSHLLLSSSDSHCPSLPTNRSTYQQQKLHRILNRDSTSSTSSGTNLQQELFHQPLQLLWTRFWVYLAATCWQQYRFPLILTATGSVLQVFTWWHYFALSPRLYLTALLVMAGFVYLQYDPNTKEKKKAPLSLDLSKYGRGLTLWWLCLPALLELRALHLLVVQLLVPHAAVQTVFLTCAMLTLITIYFMKYNNNNNENNNSPRRATYQAWIVLYVAALLVALASCLTTHSGALLAPLLTCSGIFLMTQQANRDENVDNDQWMVQQALRHGLHDVLQTVGTAVQQDELLQLAMVRWIVEYWSTNNGNDTTTSTPASQTNPLAESRPSSSTASPAPRPSATPGPNTTSQELGWSDLFPMLTVTADQLASEVQVLQHPAEQNAPSPSQNQQQQQHHYRPSQPQHVMNNDLDALAGLKSMLASMNIDEDAKPSVDAYKNAVEAFPPATRTAIAVSVLRRCPATILLLGHVLFANTFWGLLAILLLLGPLVVLEYMRIYMWACACQPSYRRNDKNVYGVLQALEEFDDTMVILLSDDQYDPAQPPTLLIVWQNVIDSVHALELSLTTARCVQTTAVTVDFAQNILSLAQFGWEISQHGWGHGARVLVQEWIHLNNNSNDNIPARMRYTDAARNALRNSQTMNRNLRALWNENEGREVVAPLVALVPVLIGYGWLWGGTGAIEENPTFSVSTESTVVIEELDEKEEAVEKEWKPHVETVNEIEIKSDADLRVVSKSDDSSRKEAENGSERVSKHNFDPLIRDIFPSTICDGQTKSIRCTIGESTAPSSTSTEAKDCATTPNSTDAFESLQILQPETLISQTEIKVRQTSLCLLNQASMESKCTDPGKPFDDDDDNNNDSFKPLESGDVHTADTDLVKNTSEEVVVSKTSEDMAVSKTSDFIARDDRAEEEDENLFVKVGGGLAVLGAVVGGVALAAGALKKDSDDWEKKSARQNKR